MCWLFYDARPRAVVESKRVCQAILTWAFASDLTSCLLCSLLSLSILLKKHGHVPVPRPLYWFFPERSLDHSSPRGFYCCLFHSERISDNYIRVFCIPSVQCEPHENRFGSLPPPPSFFSGVCARVYVRMRMQCVCCSYVSGLCVCVVY